MAGSKVLVTYTSPYAKDAGISMPGAEKFYVSNVRMPAGATVSQLLGERMGGGWLASLECGEIGK
jgi:hypothetical protein